MTRLRLTPKLILVFVAFAAALLVSVSVLAYQSGRAALEAATISDLVSTAVEKEAALNGWIRERQRAVTAIAASPKLVHAVTAFSRVAPDTPDMRAPHSRIAEELRPGVCAD